MDKSPYRNDSEEKEMRKLDPINYAKNKLIKDSIFNEEEILKIDNEILKEMDSAMEFAIKSPVNDKNEILQMYIAKKILCQKALIKIINFIKLICLI